MALPLVETTTDALRHVGRVAAALSLSVMLSACAQQGELMGLPNLLASNQPSGAYQADASATQGNRSELEKATAYWGKQYAKNPQDLNAALSYAKNLKALNQKRQALAVLQNVSRFHGRDRRLASEYGRLALDFDQVSVAEKVLAMADDPGKPDWRVISARGTIFAKRGQYSQAIPFYERALALSPGRPSLLNNLAMAYVMKGEPERAEPLLRQASQSEGGSTRVRQNLALALGLQGKYEESTHIASQDSSVSTAAQNTNAIRQLVKLKPKTTPSTVPTAPVKTDVALKPTANTSANTDSQSWQTDEPMRNAEAAPW